MVFIRSFSICLENYLPSNAQAQTQKQNIVRACEMNVNASKCLLSLSFTCVFAIRYVRIQSAHKDESIISISQTISICHFPCEMETTSGKGKNGSSLKKNDKNTKSTTRIVTILWNSVASPVCMPSYVLFAAERLRAIGKKKAAEITKKKNNNNSNSKT